MKLAIIQPYFLPYIGYFQLINAVDKFVIYDDVNFIKKGWINRNKILVNGKEHNFTVPLKGISQNKLIKDIEIDDTQDWRIVFLKMINIAYKKAPFFEDIFPLIKKIIDNYKLTMISDLIFESLKVLNAYLGIETSIVLSSKEYDNTHLKAQERIISICKKEKADHYINPIGGVELYSKIDFKKDGIVLNFLKSDKDVYRQFDNEFISWLSIIDVMMFNSKGDVKNFLDNYKLI